MSASRRVLGFVRRGLFSNTNLSVEDILRREFPELEVWRVDVRDDLLAKRPALRAMAWGACALRYGARIARRIDSPGACFYRTAFVARAIRRGVQDLLGARRAELAFTFQTSSLYGADLPGVPHVVYTDHTHLTNLYYPSFDRRRLYGKGWLAEERLIYERAARVLTMSDHVARSLVEHYGIDPGKVACVLAGTNTRILPEAAQPRDHASGRILFVGVDWARKGGPELVEAFRRVRPRHPRAELVVVGCSPEGLAGEPGVVVRGRIPLADVGAEFARAALFCLPTKIEPFGIAFVEAHRYGLPVIGTDLGAIPQIVRRGETGWLVPPGDVGALAEALDAALSDPARLARLGAAGRAHVDPAFTWEAVGKRIREQVAAVTG